MKWIYWVLISVLIFFIGFNLLNGVSGRGKFSLPPIYLLPFIILSIVSMFYYLFKDVMGKH